MGWIEGGYQALVDRLADRDPRAAAARSAPATPVRSCRRASGRAIGVVARRPASARTTRVVTTQLRPNLDAHARPRARAARSAPDPQRYLGIVCLVARVAQQRQPVLRAEHHRPPRAAHERRRDDARRRSRRRSSGHLVYLPNYVNPDSPELEQSSAEITDEYLGHVQHDVPGLPRGGRHRRARSPAPASPSRSTRSARAASRTRSAAPGLVVASSAQVYPDIVHGQAILGVADGVADGWMLVARLSAAGSGMTMHTRRSAA